MTPMQQMFLGLGAVDKVYIDQVFSPTVWIGNGNDNRDIVNGIDISTEGGMVWIKRRNEDRDHSLFDTIRGTGKMLSINDNTSEDNETNTLTQFNTNGFRLNSDNYVNSNNNTYCSWTFRKCPKFFTMATWSGNATSGRQIAHDLECVPGVIIVKCYSSNGHAHAMYHKDAHASQPEKYFIPVDTGTGATQYQHAWNNTAPTATHFTVGNNADFNGSGKDYVAWIFAHNNSDGDFGGQSGANGDVIKSGVYTGDGSTSNSVNVGFEPQFLMIHKQDGGYEQAPIYVYDCIRGIVTGGNDPYVQAAFNSAEVTNTNRLKVTATGFTLETSNAAVNENTTKYLYTAIRRPDGYVGKPADAGTDVFAMDTGNGSSTIPVFDSGFPVDFTFLRNPTSTSDWFTYSRLTQTKELVLNTNAQEGGASDYVFDSNVGWGKGQDSSSVQSWMWKRGHGMDLVTYSGNSVSGTNISHSLNAVPQMIWIKRRNGTKDWQVGHHGANGGTNPWHYYLELNEESVEASQEGIWNNTAPTSTQFTVGNWTQVNNSSGTYIAMLFTSISGISKIGSYTGDGTDDGSNAIDVGFTPRFLMLKSMNNAGGWYIVDTARGFSSSANSPYLRLNETNAQNSGANTVRQTSTGFNLYSPGNQFNANGTKILYYAHA